MKTTNEILKLTDSVLLDYICANDNDEIAYNEFVTRYITDIQEMCAKFCRQYRLDNHIGLQIAHDSFEKVRKLKTYDKKYAELNGEKKSIINFFFTVCRNLFSDHFRKIKSIEQQRLLPQESYFDQLSGLVEPDIQANKNIADLTKRIIKKLNPKEFKVVLADLEYKRHQKYLPDEVVASLCTELNVKEAGIRKLRERAIVKIKKEIDVINGEQ